MTGSKVDPALVERFRRDVAAIADIAADGPLGVAVSGGADSLALLLLAHAACPGRVRAVSIDHGLRAEAAAECGFVGEVCAKLGVPHETIRVKVRPAGEGLQAAARWERRIAFGGWCHRHGARWMMTAHHADDQAETMLMRLARGSGVGGLAGIGATSPLAAVPPRTMLAGGLDPQLIRPLLGWTRAELATVTREAGRQPVADPSNDDPAFDRTRFRKLLAETDLLDARRLATVARNCREANAALAFTAAHLARTALRYRCGGAELDAVQLEPWPREIVRRLLEDVFSMLGEGAPRGGQIARLVDLLRAGRAATLAGIKAVPGDGVWAFTRAPPHRAR